jgi:hypothetical protein
MASIKKRCYLHTFLWQVQIRRKGIKQYTISFCTEEEAKEWVALNEERYLQNPDSYHHFNQKDKEWLIRRRIREFKNDARKRWMADIQAREWKKCSET